MNDIFLLRSRAKLAIAKLLGFLDWQIRRKLQSMSDVELWEVRRSFQRRIKELASLDSPGRLPSMGSRIRIWREHSFKIYLDEEDLRRSKEKERMDPSSYWGPTHDKLRDTEVVDFFAWKHKERFWDFDYDKYIRAWRRETGRILPVLPRSGSLPSNYSVQRSSDNREGSGPPGAVAKAGTKKAPQEAFTETEGEIFGSLEDCEVH